MFAHRGGAALAPENTLPAFDRGMALGADGLEMDVRLSRDGVVVVHHDATLDRTTNGHGPLSDRTARELGELDAGFRFEVDGAFPLRGTGIRIPRLSDVLTRFPDSRHIVEIKADDHDLAKATIDVIRGAGAVHRIIIGSFHTAPLETVRGLEPRLHTGASKGEIRRELVWSALRLWRHHPAFRTLQVPEERGGVRVVSRRFIAAAHRNGVEVWVWTVNRLDDIIRLLDWGADGIMTDRPDVAVPAVQRWFEDRR